MEVMFGAYKSYWWWLVAVVGGGGDGNSRSWEWVKGKRECVGILVVYLVKNDLNLLG